VPTIDSLFGKELRPLVLVATGTDGPLRRPRWQTTQTVKTNKGTHQTGRALPIRARRVCDTGSAVYWLLAIRDIARPPKRNPS